MQKKKILILTEVSPQVGFGHLNRCIFLAKKLNKYFKVYFFFLKNDLKRLYPKKYSILNLSDFNTNKKLNFSALLIDLKKIDTDKLHLINELGIKKKITISDKVIKKIKPIFSIIPYILKKNFNNKKIISGINSIIYDEKLKFFIKKKKIKKKYKQVAICMGGSDPENFTIKVVNDLINLGFDKVQFNIIIGPMFDIMRQIQLKNTIKSKVNFKLYKNPVNFYNILKNSDLGIINSGNIKYELLALGVPFLLFSNDTNSKKFCKYFSKYFKFYYFNNFQYPGIDYITTILKKLMNNDKEFDIYSNYNKKLIRLDAVKKISKYINSIV